MTTPAATARALRFCLSRNRLLTLPSGAIVYFSSGKWVKGHKTSRIWPFVIIDNLRVISWQLVLFPLLFALLAGLPPHWFALALLLPLIEIAAALARRLWLRSVPVDYSYNGAMQMLNDLYPAVYKGDDLMWASLGRRLPLALLFFFMLFLILMGGWMGATELMDIYCRTFGECRIKHDYINYDNLALAGILLLIASLLAVNFYDGPVSLPIEL